MANWPDKLIEFKTYGQVASHLARTQHVIVSYNVIKWRLCLP